MQLPRQIFKAYDIRGIVGQTLTAEIVEAIGQAIGSEAAARRQTQICIGYDGRLSGPELAAALSRGIRNSGLHVIELGMVATPMLYFATCHLHTGCGVMVTGSHNPPDYNGLKIMLAGETLSGEAIAGLHRRVEQGELYQGSGTQSSYDIAPAYHQRIVSDIQLDRPMKIVVDCGSGVAGAFAPELYRALGCSVQPLYCEVDGNFPHHHPDPSVPANLADLIRTVRDTDAELGLAFDGDGDRLGVVTKDGQIIYPDRQLMLFAADVLAREPGANVLYDIKSTRNLKPWVSAHGGVPVIWKTGHSLMKAKMRETDAALAGEMSGHIFFRERWYGFDDGLYAGARLLEILSRADDASALLNALPDSVSTPELQLPVADGEAHALIERLQHKASFAGAIDIIAIDGLRVEYPDGFGLMRASNTTPVIVLRFEADDRAALERIQHQFRVILLAALPTAQLPF